MRPAPPGRRDLGGVQHRPQVSPPGTAEGKEGAGRGRGGASGFKSWRPEAGLQGPELQAMEGAVRAALFLGVLVLPNFLLASRAGTHSLCYDFTINPKAATGQQWCTVQGQVDQKNFLSYDCGLDKVKSLSALGGKVSTTITWEEQNTMLREMGDTLKQQLADIKAENGMGRGLHTLEGRMYCHCKSSGCTSGSWQFGFNGQMWLRFEVHPESNCMKEKWENDREVTKFLQETSMGDCRTWLQNFLKNGRQSWNQ
ncbi:UL16-binding protein 2-like isoform X7 [Marmota marmota marmota]|uniref:UL16-binding protein 2-like isoform X7 n=1 Tax=Marmota marmota marmota TaxID=9994 RepID=UPI002092B672|nr:UL16-binding protein 2-like isoform X7 [Marmota marmota marmota]